MVKKYLGSLESSFTLIIFFLLTFVIIFTRNLDPILNPTLYAEDGAWTADLLRNGFIQTTFESRVFPILGFTIFYVLGNSISSLISESPLFYLPLVYYIISNLFVAAIAVIGCKRSISIVGPWAASAIWISIVFLPVGNDGNDIYGRILNLGFFFPYLQVLLVAPLMAEDRTKSQIFIASLFSLISGLTFPVGMAVSVVTAGVLILRFIYTSRHRGDVALSILFLCIGLAPLFTLSVDTFSNRGGADMPFKSDSLVEFAVARSALYLLIFSFYKYLNDAVVMVVAFGVIALGILGVFNARTNLEFSKVKTDGYGYMLLIFWGAAAIYLIAMISMRSGLTSLFDRYTNSWPDRYFTGLNLLVFTSLIFSIARLRMGRILIIAFAIPILLTSVSRIEFNKPSFKVEGSLSWTNELCGAKSVKDVFSVRIPPEGWRADLPRTSQTDELIHHCKKSKYYNIPFLEHIRPLLSIEKGEIMKETNLKIGLVSANNEVDVTLIEPGRVRVVVTGADPSILIRLDNNKTNAVGDRKFGLTVMSESAGKYQLFFKSSKELGFNEKNSIWASIPSGEYDFLVVFNEAIDDNLLRIDLPEGVGHAYHFMWLK